MPTIVVLIVLGFAGLAFYLWRQNQALKGEQKQVTGESGASGYLEAERESVTVDNLRIGDIISFMGQDFMVEGHLLYDDEGWTWDTYMLKDGDDIRWLSVEWDDEREVSIWDELEGFEIEFPPPDEITHDGEVFAVDEKGSARAEHQGQTRRRQGARVEYVEYSGSNERSLSVEKWGGDIEVSIGREINAYGLEIFPGDATSFD